MLNSVTAIRHCSSLAAIALALTACVAPSAQQAPPESVPREAAVVPIQFNEAEAIIEAFYSTEISQFRKWDVDPGRDHGLSIRQNWAAVDYEWASKPASGPALRLSRQFNLDCSAYDKLMVKLAAPEGVIVRVTATTDRGTLSYASPPAGNEETEHFLDLEGATRIDTITLELDATRDGNAAGWLRWVGLQNTERLKQYFARWDYSKMRWDAHLKGPDYEPEFKPAYGIFMTPDELDALRADHAAAVKENGESGYSATVTSSRDMIPEQGIHEFANSGGQGGSHARNRDKDLAPLQGSTHLAVAGLVARDAGALRMAARFALSIAMSEHWETGFMSQLPGGPWEDRAFRRSYVCDDIATILDLAGEMFTSTGRQYLMRRLAEEGAGPINFVTWRHEYIFHCNQLAYFNKGRMYAYLVMEREYPRVKPYTDLALADTIDNLNIVIQPDGGCLEGPGYFNPTIRENYYVLKHYARARNIELSTLIPGALRRTADYAAAVASTTPNDVIPICDCGTEASFGTSTLDVLVDLMPDSYWVTVYNKKRSLSGEDPLPYKAPPLPHFLSLPDTGLIASVRDLGGHAVKLLIMGHQAGADHTHEDKGSFVLEFAGQTFAMDLGICEYSDPIHHVYKQCQRHNMLVPSGLSERPHPDRPLPVEVKPQGSGDATAFHATIDATPGWRGLYKKWVRTWDSPTPATLTIRDEYALGKGDAVEFYWQTQLPCRQEGQSVVITGDKGIVTLRAPEDCAVRLEALPLAEGAGQTRITVRKEGAEGTLEVTAELKPME
jgi:Heparinase II/III-like protein